VENSFAVESDYESDNIILRKDAQWARKLDLNYHPSITINDFTYRGAITFEDIQEAICAAYDKRPYECNAEKLWREHTDPEAFEQQHKRREFGKALVICILVVSLVSGIVIGIVQQRQS
jgi:hypothetical protein